MPPDPLKGHDLHNICFAHIRLLLDDPVPLNISLGSPLDTQVDVSLCFHLDSLSTSPSKSQWKHHQ